MLVSRRSEAAQVHAQTSLPKANLGGASRLHIPPASDAVIAASRSMITSYTHAALADTTWSTYQSAANKYKAVCEAYKLHPKPVTVLGLATLYVHHVVFEKKSPNTLSNLTTGTLRVAAAEQWGGLQEGHLISQPDRSKLSDLQTGLTKHYPPGDTSRLPITAAMLRDIYQLLFVEHAFDRTTTHEDRQRKWLYMLLCHQGLLRSSEVHSLKAGNVHAMRNGDGSLRYIRLDLFNTKTSTPSSDPMPVFIVPRDDELDATRLLMQRLATCTATSYVFATATNAPWQPATANDFIREYVAALPYMQPTDLWRYSQYSLRHGGTTDMLDAGVPFEMVMQQGRWKSIAWAHYRHASDAIANHLQFVGTRAAVVLHSRPMLTMP